MPIPPPTQRITNLNTSNPGAQSGFQDVVFELNPTSTGIDPATGLPVYAASAEVPNTGGAAAKTTSYTATAADCGKLLSFNSSTAVTLTLPSAIPFAQWNLGVQNIGTGALTINPNGLQIDGSSSTINIAPGSGVQIATDGTNYFTERGAAGGSVGGYPGVGSLSATSAASPSTVNLTTEGTLDWICPNGTVVTPPNGNMKKTSGTGFLLDTTFAWSNGSGTINTFTQNFTNPAVSATVADDLLGRGLSGAIAGQGIDSATAGALSFGFRLAVPAGQVSRTLKIYMSVWSGTATCTASLSDGSAANATATVAAAASTQTEGFFTIVFNAGRDGQMLTVSVLLTTNNANTPNVKFMAATLH